MSKKIFFTAITMISLLCQCGQRHGDDGMGSDYPSKETFNAIDSCMGFMNTNPGKSHRMIDSLAEARLMTSQRSDYYHAVVLFSAGILIYLLLRRNKEKSQIIETTQQTLTESKEEIKELVQQLENAKTERTANNTKRLYERIEQVMADEKLYLNPDLDIKGLAEAVNSSRSVVSACINSVTDKPFRQWLSEYRLALFVQMLKDNPDEPIDVLMLRCGYKKNSVLH